MAENVKLKDLYGDAKTYSGVDVVYLPDADNEKEIKVYTKRTVRQYSLHSSPTFEPIIPDAASGTFINDAAPGAVMEYPNGHYVGLAEDLNVIGGVANPNQDAGTAHSVIEIIITNPATRLLYTYENISSENLKKLPLPTSTILGTATFTVTPGWSKAIFNADNEIVSFEHLDDVSNIVFDVKFPTTTFVDDMVNAVMYEASQETKSITVTQNGTSSIVPSKSKSGIAQLNLEVNVAGGGGTGVQPDYAQNNTTAADYIKNRPGGYMVETPSVSKTMTAADYRSEDPDMDGAYKFSDVVLPDEVIVGGTGKVTTVGSDGVATEHDISSIVFGGEDFGVRFYMVSIAGSTETLTINSLSAPDGSEGIYFVATLDDTTVTAYISQFTTATYATTVEIPEKFTAVKPADWGASYGEDGYVAGRVGGYFFTATDFIKLTTGSYKYSWDGVIGDKETVDARINQPGEPLSFRYVKVSDETFAALLSVGANITAINTSNGKPAELKATRENLSIGMFGVISIDQFNKEDPFRVPLVVISYSNQAMAEMGGTRVSFTQGIWFVQNLNNDGTVKGYVSELALSGRSYPFMPYELVEQNPSTLTTNDQTLTDDQKLQARTNIGTVEGTNKEMILSSSTAGSTKKFKITVTDDGTLTATEVTQ